MAAPPRPPEAKRDGGSDDPGGAEKAEDDRPELLIKLQERKKRHAQRGLPARIAVVFGGVMLILAGIVLSGPGIPGPGFLVILLGLSFLALEFDRAERLLEKAIIWADNAKDRAENAPAWQKRLTATLAVVGLAAFVAAAILWDIPLLPV